MGCNMSAAYWSQWSGAELMSMQGVELDYFAPDLYEDECDIDLCQDELEEEDCCCSHGCMQCLGFSLSDFV